MIQFFYNTKQRNKSNQLQTHGLSRLNRSIGSPGFKKMIHYSLKFLEDKISSTLVLLFEKK